MNTRRLQTRLNEIISYLDANVKQDKIINARRQDLLNAVYALDELRIMGVIDE